MSAAPKTAPPIASPSTASALSPAPGSGGGGVDAHEGDAEEDALPHAKATEDVALIVGSIGMPAAARFADSTGGRTMGRGREGIIRVDETLLLLHFLKYY